MNTDDPKNDANVEEQKAPERDTRRLPGRLKPLGPGMVDVTDQHIGKSFIITGGSFRKPAETPSKPKEDKKS